MPDRKLAKYLAIVAPFKIEKNSRDVRIGEHSSGFAA
jgi:hypothetical protein